MDKDGTILAIGDFITAVSPMRPFISRVIDISLKPDRYIESFCKGRLLYLPEEIQKIKLTNEEAMLWILENE